MRYTLLHYLSDNAFSILNRWRYAAIQWAKRVLVRWEHDRHAEYVQSRYWALIKKEISQEEYVRADLRFYDTWGATWRQK